MINKNIVLPILIQVLLTFVILIRLGFLRIQSLRTGVVKIKDIALGQNAWPEQALKIGHSFKNQFEVPILFYLAGLLALLAQVDSMAFIVFSWIFVLSRLIHAYIHTGSNHVIRRFYYFLIGVGSTMILWIILAVNIFFYSKTDL